MPAPGLILRPAQWRSARPAPLLIESPDAAVCRGYAGAVVAVPAPMLAVAGRPPDDAGWAIEMKWDGVRAIVVCRGGECRLYSRNQRDITGSYPELAAELGALVAGRELTLDGEIIAQTGTGAPSFALLQRRMHVVRPTKQLIAAVPVQLHLFDILGDAVDSLTGLPYLQRRERLQELEFAEAPVRTPPHWLDVAADKLMAVARENHLEGIVSKRIDSTYQPGRRSPAWIKTPLRKTTEAIVTGWTFREELHRMHDQGDQISW